MIQLETAISIFSAIAAVGSAIYARSSIKISKKALKLAEAEHLSQKESLQIYLNNSFKYQKDSKYSIFLFDILITNPASVTNTIKRIDLNISYERQNGTYGNLTILHNHELVQYFENSKLSPFILPQVIDANRGVSHWCLFAFNQESNEYGTIKIYTVRITDIKGNTSEVEVYLIKEYAVVT